MSALLDALDRAIRRGQALGLDEIELSAEQIRRGTVRFANSAITQTGEVTDLLVQARVAVSGRSSPGPVGHLGSARTGGLDEESIAEALRRAVATARAVAFAQPTSDFAGFDDGRTPAADAPSAYDDASAQATPDDRVAMVERGLAHADRHSLAAAGLLLTGAGERAVATSSGARRSYGFSLARLDFIASTSEGGAASRTSHFGAALQPLHQQIEPLAQLACERAFRSEKPLELPSGVYDVVLEPACTAELLEWLALTSFGARTVEDGSSCLAERFGKTITGDQVTIYDDAREVQAKDGCPPRPFDSEGTPTRRVTFIENGVARACAHDRTTAHKAGTSPTGHSQPLGDEIFEGGPIPVHLHLASGDATCDQLIGRVERGLLVARFHYVNGLLETRRALMTGMTRDGLFLIENGRVTQAVRNLRWTESILEAFMRIDGVSRERQVIAA